MSNSIGREAIHFLPAWSMLVVLFLVLGVGAGCSDISTDQTNRDNDDATCEGDDCLCAELDCSDGEVCYRGVCYPFCVDDPECNNQERCYQGHCAPLDCEGVKCGDQESCYRGVCYSMCEEDADCSAEHACNQQACVDPCEELKCAAGETCYRGVCYESCEEQADCDQETRCSEDLCLPLSCEGVDCRSDEVCYYGVCHHYCEESLQCSEAQAYCDANACVVPDCDDGLKSGDQTDVDCGGSCASCSAWLQCEEDSDCISDRCIGGVCTPDCDSEGEPFGGGSGTDNEPWLICSAQQLQRVGSSSQYFHRSFLVVSDIDLVDLGEEFNIIGSSSQPFSGVFNGGGHILQNLQIHRPDSNQVGLFGQTSPEGRITGVSLEDVDIRGSRNVGALVGRNYGLVEDSSTSGQIIGHRHIGGVVGLNRYGAAIRNAHSSVQVENNQFDDTEGQYGGLVGDNFGLIEDSSAEGDVIGPGRVGGLVGVNWRGAHVVRSYATGSAVARFIGSGDSIRGGFGGLVGHNGSALNEMELDEDLPVIEDSFATGAVDADQLVGGFAGTNAGTITTSYASGDVEGVQNVGGLVGGNWEGGEILASHAEGNVFGQNVVGGLVGNNGLGFPGVELDEVSVINDAYAVGDVQGQQFVGGLVGVNQGEILRSFSEGTSGATGGVVGGLVARNEEDASIRESFSLVHSQGGERVGGLVAENFGVIDSCYAQGGAESDGPFAGGLVAMHLNGMIRNSYSVAPTSASANAGGLVGVVDGAASTEHSYWDLEVGLDISAAGTGRTSEELADPERIDSSWIFCPATDCLWVIPRDGEPPELAWQHPPGELLRSLRPPPTIP